MMRVGFGCSRRQGSLCSRLFRGFPVIVLLLLFCVPLSCVQKEELRLAPPAMPPLSRREIGYGVVSVSYTHIADEPGGGGLSLGYLRRGSVVRILERRVPGGKAPETWVQVENGGAGPGWLPESVISIYPTEAQARTASETLLQ